jgi:signal transduction histidine kinase
MYFANGIARIVGCISVDHDLRLVVLAALICLFSCFTACGVTQRAREGSSGRGWPWLAAAAMIFSAGVWATHFVAELAYAPRLPIAFGIGWTMASLVIAGSASVAGFYFALRWNTALGGAMIGAAIGAMHYSGMKAIQIPADVSWDIPLVIVSLVWAVVVGAIAMPVLLRRPSWLGQIYGTVLFMVAICGLHFTAMTALHLEPNPLMPMPQALGDWLVAAVAIVIAVIVVAGQGAVLVDVRLAKAELNSAYERLAGALETLPAGIALFDTSDRLIVFNETYGRIHPTIADILIPGTPFETILRQNVQRDRFDLGDQEKEAYIAERLARHRNPGVSFERRLTDGRWERVSEQRMGDGGLSLVITDITSDKEREAALQAARNAADSANRAKSTFLANMSHELRTPLNAVIGFSEAMALGVFGALGSQRYAEYAKDIHKSGRYLHELIGDVFDMAKIEAGRRELEREPIDCVSEIKEALTLISLRANTNGVTTKLRQDNELGALFADRRAFKQILLNIISNAVKFTPRGGKVTVQVRSSGRDGILQVIDTGVGIAEDDLKKLGTPFFRANREVSAEGTGLGLALTMSLVELHGWQLDLASQRGGGTTVTIAMINSMLPTATLPMTHALAVS